MNKGVMKTIFVVLMMVFVVSFASAGFWSDLFGKITGNVVNNIDTGLSNKAFVEKAVWFMLDREGSSAGVSAYTASLDQNKITRGNLLLEFYKSAEFQTKYNITTLSNTDFINFIINKLTGRAATDGDRVFWLDAMSKGWTKEQIAKFIIVDDAQTLGVEFKNNFEEYSVPAPLPSCNDKCGDGICDANPCVGGNCACAETETSCVGDCKAEVVQNCVDSDGGKDYYVAGVAKSTTDNGQVFEQLSDVCSGITLKEGYCYNDVPEADYDYYDCPNGCSDGACIVTPELVAPQSCNDIVKRIKDAKDFVFNDINFRNNYNGSYRGDWWINDQEYGGINYWASWSGGDDYSWNYIQYNAFVFDDTSINLESWLNERISDELCRVQDFWYNNEEVKAYVCNSVWDATAGKKYNDEAADVFWIKDNMFFDVRVTSSKSQSYEEDQVEKQRNVLDFVEKLKDNEGAYTYAYVNYPVETLISRDLAVCSSSLNISEETCNSCWSCKTEPAVCPEHGIQVQTCVDNCCNKDKKTTETQCSPGICSGCIAPRWLDYIDNQRSDNVCIPYGTRFQQITDWKIEDIIENVDRTEQDGLTVEEALKNDENLYLEIFPNNTALFSWEEVNETLVLEVGKVIELKSQSMGSTVNYTMTVDEIYYDTTNYDQSYFKATFHVVGTYSYEQQNPVYLNAYCNFDGRINQQKTKEWDGSWAKCQNSYECDSNLCSGGECVEINDMLRSAGAFKSVGVKILCRLASAFAIEDSYESCLANYLG